MRLFREAKDYSRIRYYIDGMGAIWHGPFCREDNVHYKRVTECSVHASDLPSEAVEITAYQAAQLILRVQESLPGFNK